MNSRNDPRWQELYDGYEMLYDPSDALEALEAGTREPADVWKEFFGRLHHQGQVNTASYAAVSEIPCIVIRRRLGDWEPFALVACIEDCRRSDRNCAVPEWLEGKYRDAIAELARYGCTVLREMSSPALVRSILAVIAFAHNLTGYGKLLIDCTDDEVAEILEKYQGE